MVVGGKAVDGPKDDTGLVDVCLCVAARERRGLSVRVAAFTMGFGGRHLRFTWL